MVSTRLPSIFQCYSRLFLFLTLCIAPGRACFFMLTNSEGTFAPLLYPQVNLQITFCTWQIEAPIGNVVEVTFEEVQMNSTDENGDCFDTITVFDGAGEADGSEIIPPFCGDGPPWPRYPTQLLSRSNVMTVALRKELISSKGFRASYKHVQRREEIVAVLTVELPAIVLFDRFSSLASTTQIPLIRVAHPSALSFDQINKFFYFSDIQGKFIGRISFLNTPYTEKLITENIEKPLGVAVAYLTGLLYWTDADRQEVSVSRLDGTFRKTLMSSSLNCRTPNGIVLSRDQKYVFWTCESRIVKSKADGTERNFDFVSRDIVNPTAVTIDPEGIYLYWMDAHLGVLERIRVDGIDRDTHLRSDRGFFEDLQGFVMSKSAYYWTHPDDKRLYYYRRGEGDSQIQSVFLVDQQTFGGLFYYKSDMDLPEQHLCATDNGGCDELCFPREDDVKCDDVSPNIVNCPDDIVKTSTSPYETAYWLEPTATIRSSDHAANLPYQSRSHTPMQSIFPRGTTKVVYVFTDELSHTAECSFNVTIQPRPSTTVTKLPHSSTVTKLPHSSMVNKLPHSSTTDNSMYFEAESLIIVISLVIVVLCLTLVAVVVTLCACGCCTCDCRLKERRPRTDHSIPMTNPVTPWTTNSEKYQVDSVGAGHFLTSNRFSTDDGEYITLG